MSTSRSPAVDEEPSRARFVVGIDLGTTNSAVAYVDTRSKQQSVETLPVTQNTGPFETEALETLPSFHYEPASAEFGEGALRLPWHERDPDHVVGVLARDHGAGVPARLVTSTKSWLSHWGVDRTSALLPWHGAPDVTKLSPVEVSARIVGHVREAWDHRFSDAPLAEQDVVVTVPASFDEIARELTVEAVKQAGLPRITLLEEPQAAFYAWIQRHEQTWRDQVEPGQTVLVCDIGGGTTDLTLIEVRAQAEGELTFHRVAVGEHLILGGDNLDLALARHVERKLGGEQQMEASSWSVVVRRCQRAKEELLGARAPQQITLHIPGGGSRLIGGARQVALGADEVRELLVDGFFPRADLDDKPRRRQSGFQEFGLPFAPDSAITRYLAAFLSMRRGDTDEPSRPDLLLLNGGLFESPAIRDRLEVVVSSWFDAGGSEPWRPKILDHERLDLAVARGAAYYGMVRRGEGVRISGGLARSYYVGVEHEDRAEPVALCLIPAGLQEGERVELDREFDLRIRQPVEFPLFVSAARTTDRPGDWLQPDPEQLRALPPIRTVLRAGKKAKKDTVGVRLRARLNEIGTLEAWCEEIEGNRSWNLQFDVRSATRTDVAAHAGGGETAGFLEQTSIDEGRARIRVVFGGEAADGGARPERLIRQLEVSFDARRDDWPPAVLRTVWEELMSVARGRERGVTHEARWLNLLGFSLRPGYGIALDDWRMGLTWRLFAGGVAHEKNEMCRAEWWVLWRRVAGGLSAGQQKSLAEPLVSDLRSWARGTKAKAASGRVALRGGSHETAEAWRLLGSLEWLGPKRKSELGRKILEGIERHGPGAWSDAGVWALGRIGARTPQYGPLNAVVPAETVAEWLSPLLNATPSSDSLPFAVMLMARRTRDRYRDVPAELRESVLRWMERHDVPSHYRELVSEGGALGEEEQEAAFGDSLPAGIRLR